MYIPYIISVINFDKSTGIKERNIEELISYFSVGIHCLLIGSQTEKKSRKYQGHKNEELYKFFVLTRARSE